MNKIMGGKIPILYLMKTFLIVADSIKELDELPFGD
jgi:hypothetical protein